MDTTATDSHEPSLAALHNAIPFTNHDGLFPNMTPAFGNYAAGHEDEIFRLIGDAVIVVNADATIGRINPAALEMTGYEEHELAGKSVEVLSRNKRLFEKLFEKKFKTNESRGRVETYCQ